MVQADSWTIYSYNIMPKIFYRKNHLYLPYLYQESSNGGPHGQTDQLYLTQIQDINFFEFIIVELNKVFINFN